MKRVNTFLAILIASITALIALTAIGFAIFTSTQATQNPSGWMSQMWGSSGGMMGQTGVTQASANPLLPYFGVLFAVLISVTIVGIVGLAYYLLYPQIRIGAAAQPAVQNTINQPNLNASTAYESVSKTLTEEDAKSSTS